jgi:hypothetical protein
LQDGCVIGITVIQKKRHHAVCRSRTGAASSAFRKAELIEHRRNILRRAMPVSLRLASNARTHFART